MNLTNSIKVTVVSPAATAAQTAIDSSILDMTGYDGVMFVALLGDVTDTSVLTLTAKGNSTNHLTVPAPVTQASATYTAGISDADSKVLMVDVRDPSLEYMFASLTRTTANAVVGGIIAIQYKAEMQPTTQDATVIANTVAVGIAA